MNQIVLNAVYKPQEGCPWEHPFRIIYIDQGRDVCSLLSIEEKPKAPWSCECSVLQDMLRAHQITRIELRVPEFMMARDEEIPEKHKAIRDLRWQRISPLVASHRIDKTHMPETMGSALASHAKAIGVARKTLYDLLYRYWMHGAVPNTLLPQFVKCGARGKQRVYTGARGRPLLVVRGDEGRTSKNLTEDDKAFIKNGYALYKDNKVGTKKKAYIKTLNKFYCENIAVPGFPDAEPTLKPLSELPSYMQFCYWGQKAFDDMAVLRGRKGERKWAKDYRSLRGKASDGVMGPAHRFEIDSTIADIYLVSRYNKNWVIGRPVVYVVIDVYSRMIAGVYIGLEGPSWEGARQALLNTFENKVDFCASLGITIDENDWPCSHLPQEMCADRAELLGQAAKTLVAGLGITQSFPPPYRPDWKSIVESRFRILNTLTHVHWTAGGVAARVRERGERDYRLDATLDLGEFSKIIVESILHHNRFHEYPDLLSREMIQSQVVPSPVSIWNWGFDQGLSMANEQPEELVKLHLMGKARGAIRAGGLYFEGMHYTLASGNEEVRYSRARIRGSEEVDVWYQNNDPSRVWLRTAESGLVRYERRDTDDKYAAMRLEEIQDMHLLTRHKPGERKHAALQSEVRMNAKIDATVSTAAAEREKTEVPVSNAKKVSNIRLHRAVEKENERRAIRGLPPVSGQRSPRPHYDKSGFGGRKGEVVSILSRLNKDADE